MSHFYYIGSIFVHFGLSFNEVTVCSVIAVVTNDTTLPLTSLQVLTCPSFSLIKCSFCLFAFAETVVLPNQQKHYWYHRKYPRVPTVDQCYTDDPICIFEADQQLERDM